MEGKYRILMAQFELEGKKKCIPYGDGFMVDDLKAFKEQFVRESGCSELRLTYEEKEDEA